MKWVAAIDEVTKSVKDSFGDLSELELNWKPSASEWSIAQHIEHLIIINSTYYPVLSAVKDGSYQMPWHGKLKGIVRFFGKTILRSVQPDTKRKTKTLAVWEPSSSAIPIEILARFSQHQEELKELIRDSQKMVDQKVIIPSPGNKSILYHIDTAFDIIVSHEKRHLKHAKQILMLLKRK